MENKKQKLNKKVDAALILASGMGLRMAPLTYDTPKCMVKVHGERLIERQIKQLKERGINDIVVTIGYLKECFEYLVEKYNVKLVYNDEYNIKNTLSTLYKAIPYLHGKNLYISVADIYLTENVFNTEEKESHFKGKYFKEQNNEWPCILDDEDRIIRIDKSGKEAYCMVGISYFEKDDAEILFKICDEYYHTKGTETYYWEEILDRNLDKFVDYKMYKLPDGVFNEFDTFNELKAFASNEKDYGSRALNFVSDKFKVSNSDIENIVLENNGLTNRSFVFNIKGDNKKYIARIPGVGTNEYIDRENEAEALIKLQDFDITEKLIHIEKNTGYKITEFYEDAKVIDINNKDDIILSMQMLKKLHDTNIVVKCKKSVIDIIKHYKDLIEKYSLNNKIENYNQILNESKNIIDFINSLHRPVGFCHGDANFNNILKIKDKTIIIDFEYATMYDSLVDISLFGDYAGFTVDKTLELYDIYKNIDITNHLYDGLDEKNEKLLYLAYIAINSLYGLLWGVVNEYLSSTDIKEYINNQKLIYNEAVKRFKENL